MNIPINRGWKIWDSDTAEVTATAVAMAAVVHLY
jgi:hypothetical protein